MRNLKFRQMKKVNLLLITVFVICVLNGCSSKESYNKTSQNNDTVGYSSEKGYVTSGDGLSDATDGFDAEVNENYDNTDSYNDIDVSTNRKLIKNVYLLIETKDLDKSSDIINNSIKEYNGYIEDSDYNTYDSDYSINKTYSLVIRVASSELDRFLDSLADSGTIKSKNENVKDVTLEYSDVESHKKTLEVEQDRLLQLLEKADDLDSIIKLEDKLSNIRYQLESYESQLRLYDNLVEYSTVTIELNEVEHITRTATNFGERISVGLKDTMRDIKILSENLIVFIIVNLPYLIILGGVILAIFLGIKKSRRKRKSVDEKENEKK